MPGLGGSKWASKSNDKGQNPHRKTSRRPDGHRTRSLSPPLTRIALGGERLPYQTQATSNQPELQQALPAPQAQLSPEALQHELSMFMKIMARLSWKMPFLNEGYRRATDTFGRSKSDIEAAEVQFKLDFHEFYMFLERAFLRLMAIFNITVDGTSWLFRVSDNANGLAASRHAGPHRFHANVLAALEDRRNPLNGIFRAPEVREQLAKAKELRNRWKNIDEAQPGPVAPPPLKSYNLEVMLPVILSAIEQAHDVAIKYIRENGGEPTEDAAEDWDFMVDAMDWEKV
ncbi:hypothetical protein GGR52DRAFT_563555 [Hypoxylon sp. FL1284]|nr:hypothetical protein GGR52DRAFT_563555 [Hypoxylon sp. FL1284]